MEGATQAAMFGESMEVVQSVLVAMRRRQQDNPTWPLSCLQQVFTRPFNLIPCAGSSRSPDSP